MGKRYGQFCPIAMAAEVLCERWVPLVLRELMYGSRRFNDLARGVPLMSRALLTQRLRELQEARLVKKAADGYRLTEAGEALRPIIEQMGLWAQHWSGRRLQVEDLDDALLVWSLRRSLKVPPAFGRRVVLRFDFYGLPRAARLVRRSWWLLSEDGDVEICLKDPGYEPDVVVTADLRTFTEIVIGRRTLREAVRDESVRIAGKPAHVRGLASWLPLNGEAMRTMGIAPLRERP